MYARLISTPSVLIVEDCGLTRTVLASVLRHEGFREVRPARDGLEALDVLAEWTPDVLVLDLEMPVMSGLQLLNVLQSLRAVPVIISTVLPPNAWQVKAALACGAVAYFRKPQNAQPSELRAALRQLAREIREVARPTGPSGGARSRPISAPPVRGRRPLQC